jgi:cytochrome c-type biogenesis protein CcmH/NrfG
MRRRVRIALIVLMVATVAAAFSSALAYQVASMEYQTVGRQPDVWPAIALNA